jgi:hypothetical protein
MRRDFPSNFMTALPALFVPGLAQSAGRQTDLRRGPQKSAKPLNFKGLLADQAFAKKPFYGYNISYFKEAYPQASEEYFLSLKIYATFRALWSAQGSTFVRVPEAL